MKESDKNDMNSISHIFKKKKINKNVTSTQNLKTRDEYYSNNYIQRDRTRNILINSNMNNTMINNINSGKIIKNIYINKNLINKSKKSNNMERKQKSQINTNYINNNNNNYINSNSNSNSNNLINNKRNNKNKAKHCRYYSNYVINNGINYFSELNNDIHNNNHNIGKDSIHNNLKESDIKINSKNEIDKTLYNINKSGKNIIFLNNDMKSCSLKVLPVNQMNYNNKIIVSGININGFQKLISKKFTTRNVDLTKAATDRLKIINGSSSINNSNKFNITSICNRTKYDQKINRNKIFKSN